MTIKTGKYYQNKLKTLQSNNTVTMDLTNKINNNEHTFIWRYRKLKFVFTRNNGNIELQSFFNHLC